MGCANGFREAADVVEVEELAVEADAVLAARPEQPQHVDGLVGAPAAGGEVDAHRGRLTRQRAQPHGQQPHPPLGQHVDGGQALGQDHRVVVRQQQHARAQQDPPGGGGEEAQAVERVGVGQCRGQVGGAVLGARVQHDVLLQVQRLEAALLGVLGEGHHGVGVGAQVRRAVVDRELHPRFPCRRRVRHGRSRRSLGVPLDVKATTTARANAMSGPGVRTRCRGPVSGSGVGARCQGPVSGRTRRSGQRRRRGSGQARRRASSR